MPMFTLLHEKKLGKVDAIALCPGMDLLAYCTSSTSSQSSSTSNSSSGSIHIIRWVSWQKLFSSSFTNSVLGISSSISTTEMGTNTANQQQQQQQRVHTSTPSTIRWSHDGRMITLQYNRILETLNTGESITRGGYSEVLSIGHQTRFQTTPSCNAKYEKLLEELSCHKPSISLLKKCEKNEIIKNKQVDIIGPGPLTWVVATRRNKNININISRLDNEDEENNTDNNSLHLVRHESLVLPVSLSGAFELIRFSHFPEPLPPIEKDVGVTTNSSSSSTFLPWDSETVAHMLASSHATASLVHQRSILSQSGLHGGRQHSASLLAYGTDVGAVLHLPRDIDEDENNFDLFNDQIDYSSFSLSSAAESISKLTETLSADNLSLEGSGSSKAITRSGGVRGACDDPAVVAALPSSPMSVLACLLPSSTPKKISSNNTSIDESISDTIALLAYGTFPLAILQYQGSNKSFKSVEAISLSCDLSSILDGGYFYRKFSSLDDKNNKNNTISMKNCDSKVDKNLTEDSFLQIRLHNTFSLSNESVFLLHISSVYTQVDSCLRSAARSIILMTEEWKIASTSVSSTMKSLEESISKAALNPQDLAHLKSTAASYYPQSPAPLATAELFRVFTVGSSAGPGFSNWLDVSSDTSTKSSCAGNLARLLNTIESALAALETLSVTRLVRSIELLVLSISDVIAAASKSMFSSSYSTIGVKVDQLEAFVEEASHLLVLLQRSRSRALKARAIYSAVIIYLRILRQQHQHTINLSAIADAEAEEISALVQAGADIVSTGPARRERRYRASAAGLGVSTLSARDSKLVREALCPLQYPKVDKYDRFYKPEVNNTTIGTFVSNGISSEGVVENLIQPASDPLGIFGSIFNEQHNTPQASSSSSSPKRDTMIDEKEEDKSKDEDEDEEMGDLFLKQSLSNLLGSERDINFLKIFTGTHPVVSEEFPMSAYPMSLLDDLENLSTDVSLNSQLSSQMLAMCKRWTRICSAPSKVLSSQCSISFTSSLKLPHTLSLSLQNSLASTILRASCFTYQDRGLINDSNEKEENEVVTVNPITDVGESFQFGFHTCLLSLPSMIIRDTLNLSSETTCTSGVAIILRIALYSPTETPCVEAAVVDLPEGCQITASSYFGPLPGTMSSQRHESLQAGNGFLPVASFPSDDDRFFTIVLDEYQDESNVDTVIQNSSTKGIYLAQLDTRLVTFTKCTVSPNDCLVWALKSAAHTRIADCIPKCRLVLSSSSSLSSIGNDNVELNDEKSTEAFVKAVGKTTLDACGPRGAAVVVINKQLFVFDMAEDEDES